MAYTAVISLKQTIDRLLNSCRFSLVSSTRETLDSAYEEATSLQKVLQRLDFHGGRGDGGQSLDSLDGQIREAANKLENFLELHQSDLSVRILSEHDTVLSLDSDQVRQEIRGFANKLGDMKKHITEAVRPDDWVAASLSGRPGTGRSYKAWEIFQYVREQQNFDYCVWATVGPNYHPKAILLGILSRLIIILNGDRGGDGKAVEIKEDDMMFQVSEESYVRGGVFEILARGRYMIVLDDVGDTGILDYFIKVLPLQHNGSLLLVSTSAVDVISHSALNWTHNLEDPALQYEDFWWEHLRYVQAPLEPELEEAGRKLIRNFVGRYFCFVKLIFFLRKAERSVEAWNQIADDQLHPIFQDIVDEISEVRKIKEDVNNFTASDLSHFIEDTDGPLTIQFTKENLFPAERFFPKMEVIAFVGMTGIGKTAFVQKLFEFGQKVCEYFVPEVLGSHGHYVWCYDHCVWLTLGPNYNSEDTFIDILAQIFPVIGKMEIKGDAELAGDLIQQLRDKRLFIVLDDVWSEAPLEHLAKSFPNIRGRALVTTTIGKVARSKKINMIHEMHLLSKEDSWKLLCQKVFVDEDYCPFDLVKSGKKIAEDCDGLPLTILKVANLLSRDLTAEYWKDVASKISDFVSAVKELSETLVPIYNNLPLYLKPCFLYMGVFPENYEVSTSKILRLWIAEGFLEPNPSQKLDDFAAECLLELVDRNLVMDFAVKTCRLNSVLWHLSNSETAKNKFFYTLNNSAPDSIQGLKNQRRFCIRNCVLLSIKDVYDAMMGSVSTAHSLLCSGVYHPYPVPVCWELRLLRVVDTLAIRLYDFPIEVVKLIHLRHLAITCDGDLPTTISKLWNLEFLIVSRHLRMCGDCSYLPMEIWDMKELRHIQVTGSNLPSPNCGTILPNLVTLLVVGYQTCTEKILGGIPNLQKLGIQIELAPGDPPLFHEYLTCISSLRKLESLECVVVNPEVDPEVVAPPPPPHSMFPSSLKKLSLSGLGYPWEYMHIIGQLENLKVLEIRGYAFQGDKWDTGDNLFKKLERLVIEDTDLVCWKSSLMSFSVLKHLSIKHCYKLEQVPSSVLIWRT